MAVQLVPEIILGVTACVLFVGGTFRPSRQLWGTLALAALLAALVWLYLPGLTAFLAQRTGSESLQETADRLTESLGGTPVSATASPLLLDGMASIIRTLALVGGIVLLLFSWDEVSDRYAAEYHACLLLIVAGLCLTGQANELITLFLALELISIPSYVLLYLLRVDNAAREAAVKYFLLSVFSSALLLFGFSYLYGVAGTTNLAALVEALTGAESLPAATSPSAEAVLAKATELPGVIQVVLVMVVAGLGFKITAVPFHFYAPDVYQGTPTPGAALLAFMPKVAGFVGLVRVLGFISVGKGVTVYALGTQVPILFWILAAVTMFLGNVLALLQDNLKRLLAYSSVAHAGYMLIGLAVTPSLALMKLSPGTGEPMAGGVEAVLFYLVAYGAMTVGAFAVLMYLSTPQRPVETVDDLAGLARSHPGVALLMVVFLFSLIGIPLTAGFVGKFLLFGGAMVVDKPPYLFRLLALLGALNAAIGAWYYLRIIGVMYLRSPIRPLEKRRFRPGLAALWICAAVTIALGIYPDPLVQAARAAVTRPIK
jgi:NADH-quinone oxidoreductase subunit N